MRVSGQKQIWYWGGAFVVLLLVLWGLGQTLMPFLMGAGIAYLLDPIADRLERLGLSRTMSVVIITAVAVLIFAVLMLALVPVLVRQSNQLIATAPEMLNRLQVFLKQHFPDMLSAESTFTDALAQLGTTVKDSAGEIASTVLGSVGTAVSVIALLVIVPVVTFYLLMDWDPLVARVDALLPREHAPVIRRLASEIDRTLSGFIRGQLTVMLILGTFYSIALMLVGLPFGVFIGAMAAALSFIPYVGVLVGGATAMGVALFHFWGDPIWIAAVFAIFAIGQMVEGNYLQPKIVGQQVGLHPVWLLLALSVFGSLFGFVGLLIAVPLAASLGVLVRFATQRYLDSPLFTGRETPPPPPMPVRVELIPSGTVAAEWSQTRQTNHSHERADRD